MQDRQAGVDKKDNNQVSNMGNRGTMQSIESSIMTHTNQK